MHIRDIKYGNRLIIEHEKTRPAKGRVILMPYTIDTASFIFRFFLEQHRKVLGAAEQTDQICMMREDRQRQHREYQPRYGGLSTAENISLINIGNEYHDEGRERAYLDYDKEYKSGGKSYQRHERMRYERYTYYARYALASLEFKADREDMSHDDGKPGNIQTEFIRYVVYLSRAKPPEEERRDRRFESIEYKAKHAYDLAVCPHDVHRTRIAAAAVTDITVFEPG